MTNNTTADTTAKDEQWVLLVKGQEILPGDQMLCDDAEMWVTLASPEGEIFDPSKYLPVRRKRSAIAREGVVVRYKHGKWNGLMTPDPAGYFVRAEDYDTLRAQLEAAEAEVRAIWDAMPATLRYLDLPDGGDVPLPEQVRRMGEDVVNQQARAEAAEAEKREAWAAVESKAGWEWKKRAEAAEAEVARLGAVLDRIAGYTLSQFAGPCDMVVQCVHDAMAARTKEATP